MRLFSILLVFIVATLANAVALVSEAELPTCALLCLQTEIVASSCSPTNTTCQCTNAPLISAITTCVSANCTIREALTTKAFTEHNCNAPIRDESKVITICALVGLGFSMVAFLLRLLSKYTGASGNFWWDDVMICLAMVFVIPLSSLSVVLTQHGLGKDVWTLSFDDITVVSKVYWLDESIYLAALPFTKLSILCFYLRIFPQKQFRRLVFVAMALCVMYGISFICAAMFQCIPIHGAWTKWDGTFVGHCNNLNAQGWASAAANIVLDIIVISLPLPGLSKMKMSTQKKASIMGMFCIGFFITVISVIRLRTLIQFGGTTDMTWDYVSIGYWSTIEVHVSVICACLPAIRALFKQYFPALGTQKGTSIASKSPFASLSNRKNKSDIEKGGSLVSSKPKDKDTDDFIPLVDIVSVNQSNVDLSNRSHDDSCSTMRGQPEFIMPHMEDPRLKH